MATLKTVTGLSLWLGQRGKARSKNGVNEMAAEYITVSDRDGESIGREIDANGVVEVSDGPLAQELRDAAAKNGEKSLESPGAGNDQKVCGDGSQTEGQIPQGNPSGEGFYKSQEEVDRAFGRRLAAERKRWEREHREELQQGLTGRVEKNLASDTWLPQKQMYAAEYAYFADLVTQANALSENFPGFNLLEELSNNAAFEKMVANGVSVAEAYDTVGQAPLLIREQTARQTERRRIMEEMESRTQSLPPVDHDPGLSGPALDVTRISEEELTRLAERGCARGKGS